MQKWCLCVCVCIGVGVDRAARIGMGYRRSYFSPCETKSAF